MTFAEFRCWLEASIATVEPGQHLLFPGPKNSDGYGYVVGDDGRRVYAHKYVCERAHGAPQPGRDQAGHRPSCGFRDCCAPGCLYWQTRQENNGQRGGGWEWGKHVGSGRNELRRLICEPASVIRARFAVDALHRDCGGRKNPMQITGSDLADILDVSDEAARGYIRRLVALGSLIAVVKPKGRCPGTYRLPWLKAADGDQKVEGFNCMIFVKVKRNDVDRLLGMPDAALKAILLIIVGHWENTFSEWLPLSARGLAAAISAGKTAAAEALLWLVEHGYLDAVNGAAHGDPRAPAEYCLTAVSRVLFGIDRDRVRVASDSVRIASDNAAAPESLKMTTDPLAAKEFTRSEISGFRGAKLSYSVSLKDVRDTNSIRGRPEKLARLSTVTGSGLLGEVRSGMSIVMATSARNRPTRPVPPSDQSATTERRRA